MSLIKSISGIRGTIGGIPGEGLTPIDIVKFTSAYALWLRNFSKDGKVVIGRDARISGLMVADVVKGTLTSMGFDVMDLGLSTTPTVEFAVKSEGANGGIIITASHNPKEWNALKLLNTDGEFLKSDEVTQVLKLAESNEIAFNNVLQIGQIQMLNDFLEKHISKILELDLVEPETINNAGFKIALDAVNSSGGIAVPLLLKALGVDQIVKLNCEPTGDFAHNPEPIPEHLGQLMETVVSHGCDLGIAVDPDVDRLALVCENGSPFGEEYTLVAVADYILSKTPGNTASNLSSTLALKNITEEKYNQNYYSSAVGEINVVEKMKEVNAVIGGEGNGGIIYPEMHYGRDALTGIALFLTHLAQSKSSVSDIKNSLPTYSIIKKKIDLDPEIDLDAVLLEIANQYQENEVITIDGIKIMFENKWVHLRKSNTEPVVRIIGESFDEDSASQLVDIFINEIKEISTSKQF